MSEFFNSYPPFSSVSHLGTAEAYFWTRSDCQQNHGGELAEWLNKLPREEFFEFIALGQDGVRAIMYKEKPQ